MRTITPAMASLALVLTACGGPATVAAPVTTAPSSPTPDPLNAAACREFDKNADDFEVLGRALRQGASMAIAGTAGVALGEMTGASQLARGDVRDAMDRAVAAVRIIHTKADSAGIETPIVDLTSETQAARLAIAQVGKACSQVGVTLAASL